MNKIIDAHMHFSDIDRFVRTAQEISKVDYSLSGLINEQEKTNISKCIAMGITETVKAKFPDTKSTCPMGIDLDTKPEFMKYCIGINPTNLTKDNIVDIEQALLQEDVVGIKIYAGYYPFSITDIVFEPVYKLAEKYDIPIVYHMGDTYCVRGYLDYAMPLQVDKVARDFKSVTFVIAHLGNPWITDATMVVSNNNNVYADLSGLFIGDRRKIQKIKRSRQFNDSIKLGLFYEDIYDKLMFGTDWPLVHIKDYMNFIKSIIPRKHHEDVFYYNAHKVYKKL